MNERLQRELDNSIKRRDQGETISKLLRNSIYGKDSPYALVSLREGIVAASMIHDINALDAVPQLLASGRPGAVELLDLIGENVNARECVLVLSEQLERLVHDPPTPDEDEEGEGDDGDENDENASAVTQLVRVLNLYAQVTPRQRPLTGKSASGVVVPLVELMKSGVRVYGPQTSIQAAQDLITSVSRNAPVLASWAKTGGDSSEETKCNLAIFGFVCFTLEACSKGTNVGLAQRAFEAQFPRYALRSAASSSHEVEDVVQRAWEALLELGFAASGILDRPSIGSLVLFAHIAQRPLGADLFSLLPWFLASIQTNTAVNEIVAILISSLGSIKTVGNPDVPPEFIIPLVGVLGPLAGSHPDSPIRHIVFRLLSIALQLAPSPTRLVLLQDLLRAPSLTRHMNVAAIGLVREAVMEALAAPDQSIPNPFASPTLLRDIGPAIFSLEHSDAFSSCEIPLVDFMGDSEALRLIEGLTLLYLLLQRDVNNKTGIRSALELGLISKRYLDPLQSQVDFWKRAQSSNSSHEDGHDHELMQLGILDMWLERTQSIVRSIS